jgi:hypothetical protein
MFVNFAYKYLFHAVGIFKLKTWGGGRWLYFPSEGSRATIFIALKNLSSSAGFEPADLRSNSKHGNNQIIEGDKQ